MSIFDRLRKYHFEIRHLLVLFLVLIVFQIVLYYVHSNSVQNMLNRTMDLYRQDSAERLANLTTTSLEVVLELSLANENPADEDIQKSIQAFDIILTQQKLQQNVDDICVLFSINGKTFAIDNGQDLYRFIFQKLQPTFSEPDIHEAAITNYTDLSVELTRTEQIHSLVKDDKTFQVYVPFVPKGELAGAVYMEITPNFSKITEAITQVYDETGMIFSVLILFGLLAMFFITVRTVKERDEAQQMLFKQREEQLKQEIEHEKEALFTKRIYHAHHKAEKIMGFIKEEIRALKDDKGTDEFKYRVMKYSNFVSRVIYDMKTYEPPIHVIRSPAFRTDLNSVIRFIVENVFERQHTNNGYAEFALQFDEEFPIIHINEYVIWEIVEPLIQNSLEHNSDRKITVSISTEYDYDNRTGWITIRDNGTGIATELLEVDDNGVKRIFFEHASTKPRPENAGYGCYLSYEISRRRCGWEIDAINLPDDGCEFRITIPNI